jgi:hypothetical protein
VLVARAAPRLSELSGTRMSALCLGLGLAALLAAAAAAAALPGNPRCAFAVLLASGLLLAALQDLDLRLGRWDPLPGWGQRVRAECGEGCDGFLYGNNFNSIGFSSGFDWAMLGDLSRLPGSLRHGRGFVLMWTAEERRLEGLPLRWEVVDRRPVFRDGLVATVTGAGAEGLGSLSLVRVRAGGG